MKTYELAIIGAGPAGITAGIYAARKKMDFLMITADVGGYLRWTYDIENYIGFQFIAGPELADRFTNHLKQFNVEIRENEPVNRIAKEDGLFSITASGGRIAAQSVIIATGRTPKKLNVPGEQEYMNKGVAFCATCDGPLFAGKDVIVAGGGNSGFYAALELAKYTRKIYIAESSAVLRADRIMVDKAAATGKVEALTSTVITGIAGDKFVNAVTVRTGGAEKTLPVEGVFVEIGSTPNTSFVEGVAKNSYGEIIVNCSCETSVPGLFAAGDVTTVSAKQIIVACGEGAKAAISAFAYLISQ